MDCFLRDIFWNDEGDYAKEARNIFHYNHSNGQLYVITDSGKIRSTNAREGLVTQTYFRKLESLDSVEETGGSVKEFDIFPELDVTVERFVMNRCGTLGVVAGTRMGDAELCGAMVLDFSRPAGRYGTEVPATPLDEKLFSSHPGLRILHMEIHPDSEIHVLVLTSDHTLRLYNLEEPNMAEQTFELRLQKFHFNLEDENDDDENTSWDESVPVSFAFGKGKGWNRVSILVLMSNGDLRVLCPVAPFGARYPGRWLLSLLGDEGKENVAEMTRESLLWMYKAFNVDDAGEIREQSVYSVVPHALESHVPKLSPALKVVSNARQHDIMSFRAVSCNVFPISSLLGIVIASDVGMIRTGILSSKLEPEWSLNPPQCVFQGNYIRAVRSQCLEQKFLESSCAQHAVFVVIDDVVLPDGSRKNASAVDLGFVDLSSRHVDIFRDSANPLAFVIGQQMNAYVVTFPWISSIAEYLSSNQMLPDVLPLPKVAEIVKIPEVFPVISHVLLGDKLSGTALLSVQSNGSHALRRVAKSIRVSTAQDEQEDDFYRQSKQRLLDHVHGVYAPIASAPQTKKHVFNPTAQANTPENYKSFVESVGDLSSTHVAYCHKAAHTIRSRIDNLKSEVSRQFDTLDNVRQLLDQVHKKQESLKHRQDKVQWMNSNIEDRVKLLVELHWAAPRPQSEAEKSFQHHELPRLESSVAALAQDIGMIQAQATAIKNAKMLYKEQEPKKYNIQPHALRRVRESIEQHDSLIRESSMKIHQIDRFLRQSEQHRDTADVSL